MAASFIHPFNTLLTYADIQFYPSPRPYLSVQLTTHLPWQAIRGMTNELVLMFHEAGLAPTEWANSATGKIDLWFASGHDHAIRALVNRLQPNEHPIPIPKLAQLFAAQAQEHPEPSFLRVN